MAFPLPFPQDNPENLHNTRLRYSNRMPIFNSVIAGIAGIAGILYNDWPLNILGYTSLLESTMKSCTGIDN